MKICYSRCAMRAKTLAVVEQANEIIAEYQEDGFDLTLRQLYYQFVSRDLIQNCVEEYKRLGDIVSKARRAGLIDWDAIVDRTRNLRELSSWDCPQDILNTSARQYRRDLWETQPCRIEVWFEKDALLGVFERVCEGRFRVPYFSCRGYVSDSEVHAAAVRLAACENHGRRALILHFGDHDPSGIDMSRDIEDRLRLFEVGQIEVRRLALNMDQVEQYAPPPNPAKETDSRFKEYRKKYGDESWELDALDPRTLALLVEQEVQCELDQDAWEEAESQEEREREDIQLVAEHLPKLIPVARKASKRGRK